ncbi:MAG: ankyrin repeat domain-containing protein [Parachlamydiaceae bacterium]
MSAEHKITCGVAISEKANDVHKNMSALIKLRARPQNKGVLAKKRWGKKLVNEKTDLISVYDIALIFAAKEGNILLAKNLLLNGANTKVANSHGNTALIMASQDSNPNLVKLLLENGSILDATNAIGNTALIYAAHNGLLEVVKLLIRKGANVNAMNHQGNTPLIYAAFNGYTAVVKYLIEKTNASINLADLDKRTALMWAVIRGHEEVVTYLLTQKANMNFMDCLGFNALDWAKVMQRKNIESKLKEY